MVWGFGAFGGWRLGVPFRGSVFRGFLVCVREVVNSWFFSLLPVQSSFHSNWFDFFVTFLNRNSKRTQHSPFPEGFCTSSSTIHSARSFLKS